jgi:hypothetical protein
MTSAISKLIELILPPVAFTKKTVAEKHLSNRFDTDHLTIGSNQIQQGKDFSEPVDFSCFQISFYASLRPVLSVREKL